MAHLAAMIIRFLLVLGTITLLEYLLPVLSIVQYPSVLYVALVISLVGTVADARRVVSPFVRGVTDFSISLLILTATRWLGGGSYFTLWFCFLASFFIGLGGMFLPFRAPKVLNP